MKKITIDVPEGKKLELRGNTYIHVDEPKDVRERIKTFEDACKELGDNNPLVFEYNKAVGISNDVKTYLKLRIICAALNEGWEPQFKEGEYRYYPWFELMTKEEIDNMDEEKRSRVVFRSDYNAVAVGGLVYAYAVVVSSGACAGYASRLEIRDRELAEYAGNQFADIWTDFVFKVR